MYRQIEVQILLLQEEITIRGRKYGEKQHLGSTIEKWLLRQIQIYQRISKRLKYELCYSQKGHESRIHAVARAFVFGEHCF